MRKIFFVVVLAAVAVSSVGAVSDETRGEVREELKEKRVQLRESVETLRAKRKNLAENLSRRMCEVKQNRVAAMRRHIAKLGQILDRAQARGGDTARARAALAEAALAVDALEGLGCGVVNITDTAPKEDFQKAKDELSQAIKNAAGKLEAARRAVTEVLKGLSGSVKPVQ